MFVSALGLELIAFMNRIAFCANTAWNLANFRRPIIDALLKRGDQVTILAGADHSLSDLEKIGCQVVALPIDSKGTNPLRDLILQRQIKRSLEAHQPHVLLNYTIKPVIFGTRAACAMNIPVINTITGLGTTFIKDNWITRIVERLYRDALPRSHTVFFQNQDDLAEFGNRNLLRDVRPQIVPGSGVDLDTFEPSPVASSKPDTFLLIARILKDKGIGEFVEAARLLNADLPDTRFQLLGPLGVANRTAISEADVSAWVREGVVEYLGETNDVRPFIRRSHCVVLPSYREGMPRSLLEAAAMGRPIIATDVTGCREVVQDGSNGYLCNVRDPQDLAAKIRQFISLPHLKRQEMGQASRHLAESKFDVRTVVGTYLNLIDQVIASSVANKQ
jgi:glycosyltransferase involved in cell wall biosynthesis